METVFELINTLCGIGIITYILLSIYIIKAKISKIEYELDVISEEIKERWKNDRKHLRNTTQNSRI